MSEHNPEHESAGHDENKLITLRREKLETIRAQRQAFPNDFQRQARAQQLMLDTPAAIAAGQFAIKDEAQ